MKKTTNNRNKLIEVTFKGTKEQLINLTLLVKHGDNDLPKNLLSSIEKAYNNH